MQERRESKYFRTAEKMDLAFLELLEEKDFAYITVKEICKRAGVHRSTFYLHYETITDLLSESIDYMNLHFFTHMQQDAEVFQKKLRDCPLEELYLITPRYLMPYLGYIKEHRRIFLAALKNAELLRLDAHYEKMFRAVFQPILARYHVPQENRAYIMAFYIQGMMAMLHEWLREDCSLPMEQVIAMMQECTMRVSRKEESFPK